jgi:hypothetical protein
MDGFERIDELLKDGVLSDEEISAKFSIPVQTIKIRRANLDRRIKAAKPAKTLVSSMASEYLSLVKESQQAIAPVAKSLLDHIRFHAEGEDIIRPVELNHLTQSLVRLQETLRVGQDETQKAILLLLENDVLPAETSAKIINAFEECSEDVRRKTRRILQSAPIEENGQSSLF